ncbi:MAG: anthranilate synthase component I [Chloroflexi bacterium]|jgi:anthranilate synthase component 1|uniref:Anthranilate synthase component 1 n=1 Tax=Candidatus Thermofonsia Clade 3 bacterium TaxID=2364212 RepID=A0A2M8QG54_9CHLR|nr:anthranilate synthase component I [Candidatus Roseilinea sp. NK_OTU-006]PJF48793.1 MAG: anthranilate synthase component I [Candidatus Thermofonsia Clade 3 bacterium]RMG64811.1 MAG: anthranilate synthase component I [Chloroflexota bacterium]
MGQLTITPSLEGMRALSERGNLIPIYAELPSDLDTPVSLFLRLAGDDPAFLLESVSGGEQVARYSFIGVHLREALVFRDGRLHRHTLTPDGLTAQPFPAGEGDVLDLLRREMAKYRFVPSPQLPRFCGGLVGYTGYDVVRQFERLPASAADVLHLPEAAYLLANTLVAFDHARHRLLIIANAYLDGAPTLVEAYEDAVARIKTIHARLSAPMATLKPNPQAMCTPPRANKSQAEFEQMVRTAKEHIRAGDIFQVVLSRRIERRTTAHPFTIYRTLRMLNPSPWMFYFNFDGLLTENLKLIGASPEMHARFENGIASVRPIAGTRRRGSNEHEDAALAKELLADPKERAEHVMLVDLGRNDIGRVAQYGTVRVPELMVIEHYSHVMHIVSLVEGRVRDGLDAFDVLRATFPAGTLSGAPKVRAMEIIEALEGERRGIYGGCVGYFSFNGQMDTCIGIRTIVMRDDMCYVQAGAGIVADSDPTAEFHETHNKARALMIAIDEAENR